MAVSLHTKAFAIYASRVWREQVVHLRRDRRQILDVSKPALDQDPDWSFVDHLEKLPQWKWMFEKVDERMGRGDTVFSIGQLQEAQTEEQEAERRRADDRQALLEDLKTATLPLYDANELQAQFQAVAAVQRSMAATTQTGELVPDAANVALSITDPQGRVLLLKSATDLPRWTPSCEIST